MIPGKVATTILPALVVLGVSMAAAEVHLIRPANDVHDAANKGDAARLDGAAAVVVIRAYLVVGRPVADSPGSRSARPRHRPPSR